MKERTNNNGFMAVDVFSLFKELKETGTAKLSNHIINNEK